MTYRKISWAALSRRRGELLEVLAKGSRLVWFTVRSTAVSQHCVTSQTRLSRSALAYQQLIPQEGLTPLDRSCGKTLSVSLSPARSVVLAHFSRVPLPYHPESACTYPPPTPATLASDPLVCPSTSTGNSFRFSVLHRYISLRCMQSLSILSRSPSQDTSVSVAAQSKWARRIMML